MEHILIVEDDQAIARIEKDYLEAGGYRVTLAENGETGLRTALKEPFDLILLDVMLPGMDGFAVLQHLRESLDVPILMVTARTEDLDKIRGLGLGADDYIEKPFSPGVLVARVRAVLNRTMPRPTEAADTMTFGELTIDTASHTVRVSGEEIALTPKEFDLLVFLASNKGIALSREKILQKVWNYDYFGEDRTVDTHVKMLRGHLGKCRSYIATVWGIGYKFDPDAAR